MTIADPRHHHFRVWPRDDETAARRIEVDSRPDSPEWHVICDAAINFAKALPSDAPRPPVVCVRPDDDITHYCSLLGPAGAGTYARYLGTTLPPKYEWSKGL